MRKFAGFVTVAMLTMVPALANGDLLWSNQVVGTRLDADNPCGGRCLMVADNHRNPGRPQGSRDRSPRPRYDRPHTYYRAPIGHYERRLPNRHVMIRVRNHPYYYFGGVFYDYWDGGYVIVNAPLGAIVPDLPAGYISFGIGPTRYFYFGGTYYIQSGPQYEVVAPPPQGNQIVDAAQEDMIIYPAKGQSQQQLNKDRYDCHVWATNQTGFDPSANNPNLALKPDYDRAMSACLQGRGYVVK